MGGSISVRLGASCGGLGQGLAVWTPSGAARGLGGEPMCKLREQSLYSLSYSVSVSLSRN